MNASNWVSSPFVSAAVLWKTRRSPVTGFSTVWPATIISLPSVSLSVDGRRMRQEQVPSHWGAPQTRTPMFGLGVTPTRGSEARPRSTKCLHNGRFRGVSLFDFRGRPALAGRAERGRESVAGADLQLAVDT